jgi:hypothetical protein
MKVLFSQISSDVGILSSAEVNTFERSFVSVRLRLHGVGRECAVHRYVNAIGLLQSND